MIEDRCISPDVDRSKISPDAEIIGASWLTGARTEVGSGAVIRDSRIHDAVIEGGATVSDSILIADGEPHSHKCNAAGTVVVGGPEVPRAAAGARILGSTLMNVAVGESSVVTDTWARDCTFGTDCRIEGAKIILTEALSKVTVTGPTEVSEALLGDGCTIDERGYYEGVFANRFLKLEFDEDSAKLRVAGTVDLPHVSRYGVNTINSTNSGKLKSQPGDILKGIGPHRGMWKFDLLSHEQIELGPCCWVVPWTKVIGQSAEAHETADSMVNDELMTCLMPFSMAGAGGQSTNGLVMPGELSNGFGPKQRKGAWVFTYAPDAVINMVKRLHDCLDESGRAVTDTIVEDAIRTAIAMTKAMAARNTVDLSIPHTEQRRGWPRWIGTTHALLVAHLESGMWRFDSGEPVEWKLDGGKWTHPKMAAVLAVAPDALDEQRSEVELYEFEDPVPAACVAMPHGAIELAGSTQGEPVIAEGATIADDAIIGPGCRIGPGVEIDSGARVWNSVLEGCTVGAGTVVERSVIEEGSVGAGSMLRSCKMKDSGVGIDSKLECASLEDTTLAAGARVSPFADLVNVKAGFDTILGGAFSDVDIRCLLMSMHMAGDCRHMRALPRPVDVDGARLELPAIPMIGGGSVIRGSAEKPVEMECSFIGSNAIIEPGCFVGFGSFVLGSLGPDAGLLPFTVSTGGGVRRHVIGSVLNSMASTAITHFVEWIYQAVGPEGLDGKGAQAVAAMMISAIAEGKAAVEMELVRRKKDGTFVEDGVYGKYRSLPSYSDDQLASGLDAYSKALESGAWEMAVRDGQLFFSSAKGTWQVRGGAAFWKKNE